MVRTAIIFMILLVGCAKGPESDLQYIKQARSLAAEWALINEQASARKLTPTYVRSMHHWVHDGLETASSSLSEPNSRYGSEVRALLAEPEDASPAALRAHSQVLKQIEDSLESA
jgi:hypothetical protein